MSNDTETNPEKKEVSSLEWTINDEFPEIIIPRRNHSRNKRNTRKKPKEKKKKRPKQFILSVPYNGNIPNFTNKFIVNKLVIPYDFLESKEIIFQSSLWKKNNSKKPFSISETIYIGSLRGKITTVREQNEIKNELLLLPQVIQTKFKLEEMLKTISLKYPQDFGYFSKTTPLIYNFQNIDYFGGPISVNVKANILIPKNSERQADESYLFLTVKILNKETNYKPTIVSINSQTTENFTNELLNAKNRQSRGDIIKRVYDKIITKHIITNYLNSSFKK